MKTLNLAEIARFDFRTSAAADLINSDMQRKLGVANRYAPARIGIALSLGEKIEGALLDSATEGEMGKAIRGETLFGVDDQLAVWITLIAQSDEPSGLLTKDRLRSLVAYHWSRGIQMLSTRFNTAENDFDRFVDQLISPITSNTTLSDH